MRSILPRLRPGEDDRVARALAQHALEEVGAGVDLELPGGGARPARRLKRDDAREVVDEVRAQRRVDVHRLRDARVHLLLDERGVEVAGVEGDEADLRHGRAPLGRRAAARGDGREHGAEGEARHGERFAGHVGAIVSGSRAPL